MSLTGLYESEKTGYKYVNRPDMYFSFQLKIWGSRPIGLEPDSFRILIFKKYRL